MKAIQINYYLRDAKPILHTDVVRIPSRIPAYREFKCECCGLKWIEQVNGTASVIEDEEVLNNLVEYYPDYITCKEHKGLIK